VVVIAGFVPLFFDNATIGVFANNKGGFRAACIFPFLCGLCQVFGSAVFAYWIGLSKYGGYLGMWDWAVIWPGFTVLMKHWHYIGFAAVVFILILIPQLQYFASKGNYFLMTEDYEAYKAKVNAAN
jgi:PTS system ascorbate-specific IIC component